jgi:hypothetical protein
VRFFSKFLFTSFIVRFGSISFNHLFFRLQPILCDYYLYAFSFCVQNPLEILIQVSVWILGFCFGVLGFVILSRHFKMKRFNIFFLVIIFWCETLLSHFAKFCEMFMLNSKPLSKLMSALETSSSLLLEILVTKSFWMNRFNNDLFVIHKFLDVKCCHHILQNFMEWW